MEYRRLGQTDLDLSLVGFGSATLGGVFGNIDPADGIRAVHLAVDSGINFFDSSPYYGITLSETRLGEALAGRRERVRRSRRDSCLPRAEAFRASGRRAPARIAGGRSWLCLRDFT